jgi:hypothetical protein
VRDTHSRSSPGLLRAARTEGPPSCNAGWGFHPPPATSSLGLAILRSPILLGRPPTPHTPRNSPSTSAADALGVRTGGASGTIYRARTAYLAGLECTCPRGCGARTCAAPPALVHLGASTRKCAATDVETRSAIGPAT